MAKETPELPSQEEITQLPRWAQVAFAARCARRVQPLFQAFWPDAPEKHLHAVNNAITLAERAAANAAADADANADAFAFGAGAADAANAAFAFGGAAAAANAANAAFAFAAAAAAAAAYAAARAYDARPVVVRAMRADLDRLLAAARKNRWTSETPVPPEFFGDLWPEGKPANWPAVTPAGSVGAGETSTGKQSGAAQTSMEKLVLHAIVADVVDDDALVEGILKLYRALNRYDILCGGSGLTIDDWQVRAPVEERTGVLV